MGDDITYLTVTNKKRQMRNVGKIIVHPSYRLGSNIYDVAVIRAKTPFVRSKTFYPLKLSFSTPADDSTCGLAGFGNTFMVIARV